MFIVQSSKDRRKWMRSNKPVFYFPIKWTVRRARTSRREVDERSGVIEIASGQGDPKWNHKMIAPIFPAHRVAHPPIHHILLCSVTEMRRPAWSVRHLQHKPASPINFPEYIWHQIEKGRISNCVRKKNMHNAASLCRSTTSTTVARRAASRKEHARWNLLVWRAASIYRVDGVDVAQESERN